MNLAEQLRREEGSKRCVYQDHLGFWTIGVGRLVDERRGGGLRPDEIEYLLQNDIREISAQVRARLPWFDRLNEPRQAVLIGMAFQMGVDGLMAFSRTLAAARDEHFADAAARMQQSKWAIQTPARAKRLARQMETGEWQ